MTRRLARILRSLAPVLALLSLLALASACSGGDDDAATATPVATSSVTQAATTNPSPTPTAPPSATSTTAPPTAAAGPCPANLIAFGTAQPSGGAIALTLKFSAAASGLACAYSGPVKVTLLDSGGVPLLGMTENPVTFTAASDTLLLSWRNWCAAPGAFRASVSAGNATTLVAIQGPPSCTAPKEKSMLSLAMP